MGERRLEDLVRRKHRIFGCAFGIDDARAALATVRFDDQIECELDQLEMEVKMAKDRGEASWGEVFDNGNAKMRFRVFTGCALQTIQQLSGINAIMFYAPVIFHKFWGPAGGIYGSLALNVINFFSTFITIATVERWGRVLILFSGAIVMFIALTACAILNAIDPDGNSNGIGIGVLLFCAVYVASFFVYFYLPETANRTATEIDEEYENHKAE